MLSRRIDNGPEQFLRVFGELSPAPLSVAFEATYGWSWFADLLQDAGIEAQMAHPLATKAIAAGRVKNDAVDARTLAHLLRTHLLREGWIAPPEIRERRRLVRARASLVRIGSRLRCQIHALLAEQGVHPPVERLFGPTGRRFLVSLELPAVTRGRIDAALRLIDASAAEVAIADRELRSAFAAVLRSSSRCLRAVAACGRPARAATARRVNLATELFFAFLLVTAVGSKRSAA